MSTPTLEPVDPEKDPNRHNPAPHWRIYDNPDHPSRPPTVVCVQNFDYPDYVGNRFLGYAAYPDEATALAALGQTPKPPKIIEFTHHLHDRYNSYELTDWIAKQAGVTIPDELREKIGRPFYEVSLRCSLDTETGVVTLLEAKL